jgi:hemolysin activation/secretion protein
MTEDRFFSSSKLAITSLYCFGIICTFFGPLSKANAQPSAGQLLQQIQTENPVVTIPEGDAPEGLGKLPAASKSEKRVLVKGVKFSGNTNVSESELQLLVAPYLNRELSFNQIKVIADQITGYYREQGWLVKTLIPKQDITDGILNFQIVEAIFGGFIINNESERVSTERIESWLGNQMSSHSKFSLKELDRGILLLNDLPDVSVEGSLKAGAKSSETDVLVAVVDKPKIDGYLDVDNYGVSSTGGIRGIASAYLNSPLGFGDQVIAYTMFSEGSQFGRLTYNAPIGRDGFRAGIYGSYLNYRTVDSAFSSLGLTGNAASSGAEANYPIIRSRGVNLYAFGTYGFNSFDNKSNGQTTNHYSSSVGVLGLSGNKIDGFAGGGSSTASLAASYGSILLDGSPIQVLNQATINTGGAFSKLRYSLNRLQTITSSLSGYISLSGQYSDKNLDSSEQMYLGGPFAVRAYAVGQGASTNANLATAELRWQLPKKTQLTAFYDIAGVQTWANANFSGNSLTNQYLMQGVGLGAIWSGAKGILLRASWAHRTGSLPYSVAQYMSANGGMNQNRFWLNATISF